MSIIQQTVSIYDDLFSKPSVSTMIYSTKRQYLRRSIQQTVSIYDGLFNKPSVSTMVYSTVTARGNVRVFITLNFDQISLIPSQYATSDHL